MDAAGQKDEEGDHHSTLPSDPKRAEIAANGYLFFIPLFHI